MDFDDFLGAMKYGLLKGDLSLLLFIYLLYDYLVTQTVSRDRMSFFGSDGSI